MLLDGVVVSGELCQLLLLLLSVVRLLGVGGVVALADLEDILGLLLGFFNFFPSLLFLSLEEGDTVGEDFDVFAGLLA